MDLKWTTQNFFPLTLSLTKFPQNFFPLTLSLRDFMSSLPLSLTLPLTILSLSPLTHLWSLHRTHQPLHSTTQPPTATTTLCHPLPPPSSPSTLFESTPTYCAIHHKSEQVIHLSLSPFVPFFFFFIWAVLLSLSLCSLLSRLKNFLKFLRLFDFKVIVFGEMGILFCWC